MGLLTLGNVKVTADSFLTSQVSTAVWRSFGFKLIGGGGMGGFSLSVVGFKCRVCFITVPLNSGC